MKNITVTPIISTADGILLQVQDMALNQTFIDEPSGCNSGDSDVPITSFSVLTECGVARTMMIRYGMLTAPCRWWHT